MDRPFSRAALADGSARDESSYLFFYGHQPSAGDLAVLSNWYKLEQPFHDGEGNAFPTSEHYMMYAKALLFGDKEMARLILDAKSPGEAKKLGRRVRNFDDEVWRERAVAIVADGCTLKFAQCALAHRVLLESEDRILVEAAPRDRIWGIGMGKSNPARLNPANWRGQNLLGEALMIVRGRLRSAETGGGESDGHTKGHQLHAHLVGDEPPCNG